MIINGSQAHTRLNRFSIIDTSNRDDMRDLVVSRYGAANVDFRQSDGAFRGVANYLPLKNLDLSFGALSADMMSVSFRGNDFVRQQFVLGGHSRITIGASQLEIGAGSTGIVPPDSDFGCTYLQNCSQLFLRIPSTVLRSKLTALIGAPVSRSLGFAGSTPAPTPEQMRLRRSVDYLISEVDRDNAHIPELHLAEFEQLVIVSFLFAHQHKLSRLLGGTPADAAPWQVQLVEEFVEANWDRPITIEEIADATGVGVRSIFFTFKRARGYTPMAFVQRVRLAHARRMLQRPDAATSVIGISLKCGFSNAGHFARYYREAFGELPSKTLADAKKSRSVKD
jgi:AraC-like DNA-binding protein